MSLKIDTPQPNVAFPSEVALLTPKSRGRCLVVLHSGTAVLAVYPEESLQDSKSFFCVNTLLPGNTIGELSLCQMPSYPHYFAIQSGFLTVLTLSNPAMLMQHNPQVAMQVLIGMYDNLNAYKNRLKNLQHFTQTLTETAMRLLLHASLDKAHGKRLPLHKDRMASLKAQAKKKKVIFTKGRAFQCNIKDLIPKFDHRFNPSSDTQFIDQFFDNDRTFMQNILHKKPDLFLNLYEVLGRESAFFLNGITTTCSRLYKELLLLTEGQESLLKSVAALKINPSIKWSDKQVQAISQIVETNQDTLLNHGAFLERLFDLKHLHTAFTEFFQTLMQVRCEPSDTTKYIPSILYPVLEKTSGITPSLVKDILANLSDLNTIKDFHDPQDKHRKIIRHANQLYIKLFNAVIKHLLTKEANLNLESKEYTLFLRHGLLNDGMVTAECREVIGHHRDVYYSGEGITLLTLYEWLQIIYRETETPSNTILGVTYQKYLQEKQKKQARKRKDTEDPVDDTQTKLSAIDYEIENMVVSAMKITSESPLSALFILTKLNEPNKVANLLIKKEQVHRVIEDFRKKDYSLFYREVLYRISKNFNDIIHTEVMPYVIILPTVGNKMAFWQDISGNNKRTKARFMIPIMFTGDLKKATCKALAEYRWELCRTIKGHLWSSAVDGGITGAFYDYIMTYKKNSKLSVEAKDKIRKFILNNRNDNKHIFVSYYTMWMEHESKGIMKLDSVARDFFFRHIPFSKAIRSSLEKLPTYERLINRHNHMAKGSLNTLETKYRKLQNDRGILSQELQRHIDFYSL